MLCNGDEESKYSTTLSTEYTNEQVLYYPLYGVYQRAGTLYYTLCYATEYTNEQVLSTSSNGMKESRYYRWYYGGEHLL
jgi:hypothetical protein